MPSARASSRPAAAKPRKPRQSTQAAEAARFAAWEKDFDLRMAKLRAREDALMRKLGLDPETGLPTA